MLKPHVNHAIDAGDGNRGSWVLDQIPERR
jgi:hypothetical protein